MYIIINQLGYLWIDALIYQRYRFIKDEVNKQNGEKKMGIIR